MSHHPQSPTMQAARHRVAILDDHPLVARGLAHYFETVRPNLDLRAITGFDELHALTREHGCPALVIADVWLASGNVLEGVAQFRDSYPDTRWLAMSGDDDPLLMERMRAGRVDGFVPKAASPEVFALALDAVLSGGQWFESTAALTPILPRPGREWLVTPEELGITARQGEILALVMHGLPNKRIALNLGISESTVKEHVTGILERLGVRTRIEAITQLRGRRISPSTRK
jgi:DNA-binding NarL/FixJ family response regulator